MTDESIGQAVARIRKLRGLTQRQLADRIPCSVSILRKVEQGDRPASPSFIAAAARTLHVQITELTGQPYRGSTPEDDRLDALMQPLRREVSAYRLAPVEFDGPLPSIEDLTERVGQIRRLAHSMVMFKLGEQLPAVLYDLRALVHSLPAGGRREKAFGLLASAYENAMLLTYKLGYIDLSSVTVDRYEWATAQAGDPLMARVAEYFRAGEVIMGGEFEAADKFLEGSLAALGDPGDDPVALSVQGSLQLKRALAMARGGRADAAYERVNEAAETAARMGADRDDYRLAFGPTNAHIWRIGVASELGDADRAIAEARDHAGDFEPPPGFPAERVSHFHIDLARSYSWTGRQADRDKALRHLLIAEKAAPQHTRLHPMTRETVRRLASLARKSPDSLIGLASRAGVRA